MNVLVSVSARIPRPELTDAVPIDGVSIKLTPEEIKLLEEGYTPRAISGHF